MKFAMKQYILNQIIFKAKLFTVLGSQYIGNLELFWTNKHSGFYTMYYE